MTGLIAAAASWMRGGKYVYVESRPTSARALVDALDDEIRVAP